MAGCGRKNGEAAPEAKRAELLPADTGAAETAPAEPYTFAWMTDTQFYSESAPEIYESMAGWIVNNADSRQIKFLFHTGDVVNQSDEPEQWENADKAMRLLDGIMPYSILPGNHDLTEDDQPCDTYLSYFGEQRFAGRENIWFYQKGTASAQLVDTGSRSYLVLALGYRPDEAMIEWGNDIIARHADLPVILTTHDYMKAEGTRSRTGDRLFAQMVEKNPNVVLVLCGHNHNAARLADEIDDNGDGVPDRTVYQLLADYQETPDGGSGFLRLLTIDEARKTLSVTTYSPYLDRYDCYSADEYPEKDHFELDISSWF